MRSTHRKTKRRSCTLCKPHKMGWAPKDTTKQQGDERAAEAEIRDARWTLDEVSALRERMAPPSSSGSYQQRHAGPLNY